MGRHEWITSSHEQNCNFPKIDNLSLNLVCDIIHLVLTNITTLITLSHVVNIVFTKEFMHHVT